MLKHGRGAVGVVQMGRRGDRWAVISGHTNGRADGDFQKKLRGLLDLRVPNASVDRVQTWEGVQNGRIGPMDGRAHGNFRKLWKPWRR